jgi:beta-lactamase regulating signal transducer with metallopeptidase domain
MEPFLRAALANAVLVALLAPVVAVAGRLGRRPALRHALWLLLLLKLVTPPLVPVPISWPEPAPPALPVADRSIDHYPLTLPVVLSDPVGTDAAGPPDDAVADPLPVFPKGAAIPHLVLSWQHALLAVWLAGSLAWCLLVLGRSLRFQRLLRHVTPAGPLVEQRAATLAARLGVRSLPRIGLAHAPIPPLLWAILGRPRLLLPAALWDRLGDEQRDALLAHELAHLRRGDHWVRRLEMVVTALYWWHPAVWWARHAIRDAEEECCDAWVVWALPGAAEAYAAAVVETVAFVSGRRRTIPVGASGISQVNTLKRRLNMIVQGNRPRNLSWAGLLLVCILGAVILPLWPTWAEADPTCPTPPSPPGPAAPAAEGHPGLPGADGGAPPIRGADQPAHTPHPHPVPRGLEEQIQNLRDEIELLEAQLEVKRAQLKAVEITLAGAMNRQAQIEKSVRSGAVSQEMLLKTREEVESLQAQLQVKHAELREPEVRIRQAKRRLEVLTRQKQAAHEPSAASLFQTLEHDFGAVSGDKLLSWSAKMANPFSVTFHIASVDVADPAVRASARSVELTPADQGTISVWLDPTRFSGAKSFPVVVKFDRPKEEKVVLVVKASKSGAAPTSTPTRRSDEATRFREVEMKLDALLMELEKLRQELRQRKPEPEGVLPGIPEGPRQKDGEALVVRTRRFTVPIRVDDAARGRVKKVQIYLSTDMGQTWRLHSTVSGDFKPIDFEAPGDGHYWFTVVTLDEKGAKNPADLKELQALLKVRVEAGSSRGERNSR